MTLVLRPESKLVLQKCVYFEKRQLCEGTKDFEKIKSKKREGGLAYIGVYAISSGLEPYSKNIWMAQRKPHAKKEEK